MEELQGLLQQLGQLVSGLQTGVQLPDELQALLESRQQELNLPNDPQLLRKRLKEEQRKLKANLKKLRRKAGREKAGFGSDSSSKSSDEDEISSEVGAFLGAVALGNMAFCSVMLQRGVDVNVRGPKGATALHVAAQENKADVLNLLLSRGADVDLVDNDGDTPLVIAVIKKHRPLIRLLVERGTDLKIVNKKGFTAADLAFALEDMETLTLLEERQRCMQFDRKVHDESILNFAQKGSTKMIEYWLSNFPREICAKPCDLQYKDGRTIAFTAALNGSEELLAMVDSLDGDLDLPDNSNSSPLFCACQNGYESIVKMLIDKKCDVNRVRDTGRTALFSAIVNSHFGIVKILVEAGADFNVRDKTGTCPLACCVVSGCQDIFDYLLDEKKANCDAVDESGNDLVLLAALHKRFGMLKQLHNKGLPLDAVNQKDGETALLSASQVNCPEMVEYLINKGCNVNIRNKNGVTPVLRASFNADLSTVKLLEQNHADLDVKNRRGETAILVAAQKKSVPLVSFLYKNGCDINVVDKNGNTLALYAAKNNDIEMLKSLREKHAPLDIPDKKGNTPLIVVTMKPSNLQMLQELVAYGCNPEHKNNSGNTAVSIAAKQGNMEVLQYLRSIGEPLMNITKKGKTVLMQICKRNQMQTLRYIKQQSDAVEDICATDDAGRTAVHYAAIGGHSDVLDFLVSESKTPFDTKDYEGNTPFMLTIKRNHKEVAERLNDLGADVNLRNNSGENAVHLAVQTGSIELLRYLDQKGCYLDQEDKVGRTPLMLACAKKKLPLINFLLSKDCFPKSFSKDGRQIIHAACETGSYRVAKRLIDIGVPVHAADSNGVTTLMLASLAGSEEIVSILLERNADLATLKDEYGKSALEYAILGDHSHLLHQLISAGCDVNNQLSDGRTPLLMAIESGAKNTDDMVQVLMKHNCKLDVVTGDGMNAAHLACKYNKLTVLKMLIDKQFRLDQLTNQGDSCLTLAVPKGSPEMVGLLVDVGLDKSHTNHEHHSAVSLACRRGDEQILSKVLPISDSDISRTYAGCNSLLHLACEGGSTKLVESLIDRNMSVNVKNSNGDTPLHIACIYGSAELVGMLLKREVNLNLQNNKGEIPIFGAISNGNKKVVQILIDERVDVNARNKEGVSVLAAAFHKGKRSIIDLLRSRDARLYPETLSESFEVFRINLLSGRFQLLNALLDEGLSVDRREKNWHLLHLAIETSRSDLIFKLIERGASVKVKDSNGNTPLLTAIRFGRIDVAKKILEEHPETKDDVNNHGDNVLHVAVAENKISTVKWLLSTFKFDPDKKNNEGQTALHIAVLRGNEGIYRFLAKKRFNPSLPLENQKAKLNICHLAAMSSNMSLLNTLHKENFFPRRAGRYTPSVLQQLAEAGQTKTLQWLCEETGENLEGPQFRPVRNAAFLNGHEFLSKWMIQRGVDMEHADEVYKETAISSAVKSGNFHLCRELIEKVKCKLDVMTKHGVSLVQKAVVADHLAILKYVILRGAPINSVDGDGDSPILESVYLARPQLMRTLHKVYRCSLEQKNRLDRNAAHIAAIAGGIETMEYLKQHLPEQFFHDADINGDTPLMLAVLYKHQDMTNFILEKFNPNANHINKTKSCALHWAAHNSDVALTRMLVNKGAAVDSADRDGATPLMLAVQAKSVDCIRYLVDSGASLTVVNQFGDSALGLMLYSDNAAVRAFGESLLNERSGLERPVRHSHHTLGHLPVRSIHFSGHYAVQSSSNNSWNAGQSPQEQQHHGAFSDIRGHPLSVSDSSRMYLGGSVVSAQPAHSAQDS